MCIAILKTKEGNITDEQLRNCFRKNKDGAGIAYTINNELYMIKGIFNIDEFVKQVRAAEEVADNNMLIHCRITTSGHVDELNCHPHILNEKMVMIHNGILDIVVPKDSPVSDTILFCNRYLKQFRNKDLIHNRALKEMLAEFIGSNNKFVFLNNLGEYSIINEDQGHWSDGVWYSNYSYAGSYGITYYDDYDEFDWEEYAYGCRGYRYVNDGTYTWDKQAAQTETKEESKTENESWFEIEGNNGGTIILDQASYIDVRKEVAKQINDATDDELDYWGEKPMIDMYDGGVVYPEAADYKDDGMIYMADVFPELQAIYSGRFNDYVERMLGTEAYLKEV